MTGPKKVAIIGAGPSGLVTAKTLLHDYPNGTFVPIIFEQRHDIGGLWPNSPIVTTTNNKSEPTSQGHNELTVGPLNPFMRTNLSRFTVAFSDLPWEVVFDDTEVPMFPQAWQVGRYLERYVERFFPDGVLRLGRRVVRTSRKAGDGEGRRWTVQWAESRDKKNGDQEINSEEFDLLVVASGYFASPSIPEIPGLDGFMDKTIHSSSLHNAECLLQKPIGTGGKLVVIGGSLSGTEATSILALHVSSFKFTRGPAEQVYEVHHICTRPFWAIPAYLPRETPDTSTDKTMSFIPLDLVMYDLSRRPPGPIEYAFGPIPAQKAQKTNDYLYSLLGSDYGKFGNIRGGNQEISQPPWVSIGNDYAEYVRSGAVTPTIGRVSAVHRSQDSDSATIDINLPDGEMATLDNVAGIVLATGFTPYNSLSFLPSSVLSLLEYSQNDPFFPLVLDGNGTMHADVPDVGFVGFYRGPYWGVMEMQARHVAANWARAGSDDCDINMKKEKEEERQRIRGLRNMDPQLYRGQFPMGDYVGLMESFSRKLGMSRLSLEKPDNDSEEERSGQVLPARYTFAGEFPSTIKAKADRDITLKSLRGILYPEQHHRSTPSAATATSTAIFRALQGTWKLIRTYNNRTTHGTATFHPRYPTSPAYEKEYLYEESESAPGEKPGSITQVTPIQTSTNRTIYRLRAPESTKTIGPNTPRILVWSVDMVKDPSTAARLSHGINPAMAAEQYVDQRAEKGKEASLGGYTLHAAGAVGNIGQYERREYTFHFQGVSVLSWECCVKMGDEGYIRTVYERD